MGRSPRRGGTGAQIDRRARAKPAKNPLDCPTHGKALIPTKSGTQMVCPLYECDFFVKVTNG